MTDDGMKWLTEVRKLDAGLLRTMGVAVRSDGKEPVIGFPYRRGGKVYAWKYRTPGKRFWSTQGVTRGLFGEENLIGFETLPVVITEGEIDALSVMQAGFDRAVSVPDGWKEGEGKCDALVAARDDLMRSPFVIVAGDADAAGASLPRYVANLLKGHDVRAVKWPDGCKDANDVLCRMGEGELSRCLMAAARVDPPGGLITGLSDLPDLPQRRVWRVHEKPFDWAIAFEEGALSVWTGIPGHGKSTFLTWAVERVSRAERIRVGMMGFETHPHRVRDQLAKIAYGRPFDAVEGANRITLLADLDARWRLVHVRLDENQTQHLAWLETMVETLALRDGCKIVVIDPWNELEHLPEKGETITSYVNFATKFLRQLAERLAIHIALVAHPKKMATDGKLRAPTGYDVADSSAFFNKPSLGVTVHQAKREDDDGITDEWVELHVWKVRDRDLYRIQPGKVECRYAPERGAYVPKAPAVGGPRA